MKKYSILLIAVLALAVTLSTADANAGTRAECVLFPIMLGVGY